MENDRGSSSPGVLWLDTALHQVSSMFDDQEDARMSTDFRLERFKKLECVWFLNGGLRRAEHSRAGGRRHRKLWTDAVANGIVQFSFRVSLRFPVLRTQLDASCANRFQLSGSSDFIRTWTLSSGNERKSVPNVTISE